MNNNDKNVYILTGVDKFDMDHCPPFEILGVFNKLDDVIAIKTNQSHLLYEKYYDLNYEIVELDKISRNTVCWLLKEKIKRRKREEGIKKENEIINAKKLLRDNGYDIKLSGCQSWCLS